MASVRIGMVGSGFMAHTYSEVVARYAEGGELVAIAGGSRAPSLAERYGVPCEPTIAQLGWSRRATPLPLGSMCCPRSRWRRAWRSATR